jgi:hypothetical protein
MCIVLALLPPVHERIPHRYISGIHISNRPCCCLVESTARTTQQNNTHDLLLHYILCNSYEPGLQLKACSLKTTNWHLRLRSTIDHTVRSRQLAPTTKTLIGHTVRSYCTTIDNGNRVIRLCGHPSDCRPRSSRQLAQLAVHTKGYCSEEQALAVRQACHEGSGSAYVTGTN